MAENILTYENAVISAVTDEAVSIPIKADQYEDIVIEVIATGGSVDFKIYPVISIVEDSGDLDFDAAAGPTNRYQTCSMVDVDGEIVSAGETISAAGVYLFRLNWTQALTFMGVKLTDGVGSFAGTVTVNIIGSLK